MTHRTVFTSVRTRKLSYVSCQTPFGDKKTGHLNSYLCTKKDSAVAKYALEGLPNKVVASEYKLALPDEKLIAQEIKQTRKLLEARIPR